VLQERVDRILALEGDAVKGAERFAGTCAACHGPEGRGTAAAPDLAERVPNRVDPTLVRTLLTGKGAMPAWATRFDDQGFADLRALLRERFGAPE
jgi:mono/diheme cytochrome c family protein